MSVGGGGQCVKSIVIVYQGGGSERASHRARRTTISVGGEAVCQIDSNSIPGGWERACEPPGLQNNNIDRGGGKVGQIDSNSIPGGGVCATGLAEQRYR